jgi:DNA (cytosine-5)-methyltransferase 1
MTAGEGNSWRVNMQKPCQTTPLKVLDLFSGIGAFSLGLERAGMRTIAFSEIEPYAQAILKKHWPNIPQLGDVRSLCRRTGDNHPEDEYGGVECAIHEGEDFGDCACIGTDQFLDEYGAVDVVCGGFPCQDISVGHTWHKAQGIDGSRSNLWWEMQRIIGELQPRWVIAENVAALRSRGLDTVLGSLDAIGFDAEWHCIPASAVGAEHARDRLWIIAYPKGLRVEGLWPEGLEVSRALAKSFLPVRDRDGQWEVEPDLRRAADGSARWVDRLRCVGNAVVPQIPELIGRAIIQHEEACGGP